MTVYNLGDFIILATAAQIGTPIIVVDDISSVCLSARLSYGSGGTSIAAIVRTSLDQGTSWIDIARFEFATSGLEKILNLTRAAITSPYTVTDLSSEGSNNGIIGDRFLVAVTSVGTYSGSTLLSMRMVV